MSDKPWTCPSCGRGVAPGVETCDHGGMMVTYPPRYIEPETSIPRIAPEHWPTTISVYRPQTTFGMSEGGIG